MKFCNRSFYDDSQRLSMRKSEIFNIKTNEAGTCDIKVHVLPHHENLTKEEIQIRWNG